MPVKTGVYLYTCVGVGFDVGVCACAPMCRVTFVARNRKEEGKRTCTLKHKQKYALFDL